MDSAGDYTYYKFQFTQAEAADSYMGFREIDLIGVDYTPVSDFNLPITLDENNATFKAAGFRHSICQANGEDLRFQSVSGAELKYEIVSWNQSGKSLVWVQVPSLVRNEKIIMRWGNTDAAAPSYVTMGMPGHRITWRCITSSKLKMPRPMMRLAGSIMLVW